MEEFRQNNLLETTLESFKNKQNLVLIKQTLNIFGYADFDNHIDDLITKIDDDSTNNKDFFDLYLNFLKILETKVGSSRVDLQACKLEYSIVSPK